MLTNVPSKTSNQSDIFLPCDLKYIPEEIQERAKLELSEDEETKVHSLKLLKSKLKDEPNLHWPDDDLFLLAFLRARKYDVKRAFNSVKNFYHIAKKYDEVYGNFNYDDVKRTLKENTFGMLPYRDKDGCVIIVLRTEYWNPHVSNLADVLRAVSCSMLHANRNPATQIAGFKIIFDFSGFGLSKLTYFTPRYIWLLAEALLNSPYRIKGIHLLNEGRVIFYLWTIFKQFISKKMADRFHFHGKNIRGLHKSFSPKILPEEFEGELPPFDNSEWANKMEASASYFSYVTSHGYNKKENK